jgi:hypothetical protein
MSIKYNGGYIPAVGADGTTLVANSSASTGVSWAGPTFTAGKNKIINGDFGIWQRGTSFTPASSVYTSDRWYYADDLGAGVTLSRQTFTPGAAPVAGYEGSFFYRYARTSGTTTYNQLYQPIEDVRTFAGQTVTFSFWAKADAATSISLDGYQVFGTGGSGAASLGLSGTASLTTSWQRFTFNANVPSISGKTIGTNSNIRPVFSYGTGNKVVDIWGVQLEAGSVATPFTTASGTLQGELAACQRYYWRNTPGTNYGTYGVGVAGSTTNAYIPIALPVSMRVVPTSIDIPSSVSNLQLTNWGTTSWTPSAIAISDSTFNTVLLNVTTTSLVTGQAVVIRNGNGSTSSYFLGASAEL